MHMCCRCAYPSIDVIMTLAPMGRLEPWGDDLDWFIDGLVSRRIANRLSPTRLGARCAKSRVKTNKMINIFGFL